MALEMEFSIRGLFNELERREPIVNHDRNAKTLIILYSKLLSSVFIMFCCEVKSTPNKSHAYHKNKQTKLALSQLYLNHSCHRTFFGAEFIHNILINYYNN